MANKRISELPAAGAITGPELVEIVQNGINVRSTVSAIGTGGTGTVTSFSSGNLSGLFTTNVATATTTPALSFGYVNQNANTVLAGPTTAPAAAPTFRVLVAADIPSLSGTYYQKTGNAFAGASTLGLTDNFDLTLQTGTANLNIATGGSNRAVVSSTGSIAFTGSITGANTCYLFTPTVTATADSQTITGVRITSTLASGGFSNLTRRMFHVVDNGGTVSFIVSMNGVTTTGVPVTLTNSSGSGEDILRINKSSSQIFTFDQNDRFRMVPVATAINNVGLFDIAGIKTFANVIGDHTSIFRLTTGITCSVVDATSIVSLFNIAPSLTLTSYTGKYVGWRYNPTFTGLTTPHYAMTIEPTDSLVGICTALPAVSMDINGGFALRMTVNAQMTANQNDYAIGSGSVFGLSTDAIRNITGITGGVNGKIIIGVNRGSFNLVLTNEDAGSTAANRLTSSTGGNITVLPNGSFTLIYDSTSSRWRDISVR